MNNNQIRAYISTDWAASHSGDKFDEKTADAVNSEVYILLKNGVQDIASWSKACVGTRNNIPCMDVMRNTREIDGADAFIAVLHAESPERSHWGTGALMAYAVGKGKPCFMVCSAGNILRRSHFSQHPLVRWFKKADELVEFLQNRSFE